MSEAIKAHVIVDGKVSNTILVASLDALPGLHLVDAASGGKKGDLYDEATGNFTTPVEPLDLEVALKYWDGVVQSHIDSVARAFGYGDPNRPEVSPILHAISYADEPAVPRFQNEGRALRAWRSLVWANAAAIMNAVVAGQREVPANERALLDELEGLAPAPTQDAV